MFTGRCFTCNEVNHWSYRCPKWIEDKGKERRVHLVEEETSKEEKKESILVLLEEGEHLFIGIN